jgi:hypothetical protein
VIVSAGSPAAERAWLISASTRAAAVPPAGADGLADGLAEAAGVVGRGDGEREDGDAEGDVLARRGGTVTTAGGAATAR